ncbi:hypothetical protein DH2020_001692 [Rehmannia glutinosa]|uniref:Uncharacterized protein n=1 Tax=Rehmannia glutinosa TaxID=99300 RepID=A0ABR0XS48_REHGL
MENSWDEKKRMSEEPLLEINSSKKGGNDALEKMATFGIMANMILYLTEQYHMEMATASNILFSWTAATNLTPVIGAVIADSYLGRFYTIGIGSVIYIMVLYAGVGVGVVLSCLCSLGHINLNQGSSDISWAAEDNGMILLWSTTIIPQARPSSCDQSSNICSPPTFLQTSILCVSLALVSIGAGGIRSSSLAFGANQLQKEDSQENSGVSGSYFSWYYATYTFAVFIGLTVVVYVQDNMGWNVGFAVPAMLVMFGTLLFFLGSPMYVEVPSKSSLLIGLVQVVVASYRNRHFTLPSDTRTVMYNYNNGPGPAFPSGKLRFYYTNDLIYHVYGYLRYTMGCSIDRVFSSFGISSHEKTSSSKHYNKNGNRNIPLDFNLDRSQ